MGAPADDLEAPKATTKLTDEVTTPSVEEKATEVPTSDEVTIEVRIPEPKAE